MTLMQRRRALMAGEESDEEKLPDEYQQIEYISQSSDPSAYCNTGIKFPYKYPLNIEYDFYRTGGGTYNSYLFTLFGGGSSFFGANIKPGLRFRNGGTVLETSITVSNNIRSKLNYTVYSDRIEASLDTNGTVETELISLTPVNWSNYTVLLFSTNSNGAMKGRFYGCTVKSNGKIVMKMIPCRRKNDDVAGVYDLISKQFFNSQSSTPFTKGPDVT